MKDFIPETFQFKSQDSDFSVTIPAEADAAKINPPFILFRKIKHIRFCDKMS